MEALIVGVAILIVGIMTTPFLVVKNMTVSQSIVYPLIAVVAFCFGVIPFIVFIGGIWQANEENKLKNRYNLH